MGGGGSYNPNIVKYLQEQLPKTRVILIDEIGIPVGAKEAIGFALLGVEGFVGRPMIVPQHVESRTPGIVGHIQPGSNLHRLRRHVCKFWGNYPEEDITCTKNMILLPSQITI